MPPRKTRKKVEAIIINHPAPVQPPLDGVPVAGDGIRVFVLPVGGQTTDAVDGVLLGFQDGFLWMRIEDEVVFGVPMARIDSVQKF